MPIFRVTTKSRKQTNGTLIEPGMSVQVVTKSFNNPVCTNGGQEVVDAFLRMYGVDIRQAGCLSTAWLDVERV